ncbi:MAG: hypothetical protein ACUVR2_11560, partial [Anaerolineae bacterium]
MSLNDRLHVREEEGNPIKLALVGAGQMGTGMVSQMEQMKGIRAMAVADIILERATKAYKEAGVPVERVGLLDGVVWFVDTGLYA